MKVSLNMDKVDQEVLDYLQFLRPSIEEKRVSDWIISGKPYLAFADPDYDFDKESTFMDLVRELEFLPASVVAADAILDQVGSSSSESLRAFCLMDYWNDVAVSPRFFKGELL